MCEVNTYGSEKRIDESLLQKTFDRVWIDLEADASEIEEPSTTPLKPRGEELMVKETLEIVRSLHNPFKNIPATRDRHDSYRENDSRSQKHQCKKSEYSESLWSLI
jgi:hypothetical protein